MSDGKSTTVRLNIEEVSALMDLLEGKQVKAAMLTRLTLKLRSCLFNIARGNK